MTEEPEMETNMHSAVMKALARRLRAGLVLCAAVTLVACGGDSDSSLAPPPFGGTGTGGDGGGGGGGGGGSVATSSLSIALSSSSISSASPATVTATLKDAKGSPVAGQVVTFTVVGALAQTNVPTALTNSAGKAIVTLVPTGVAGAGADEVVATTTSAGTELLATAGFQVQATNVTIDSFTSAVPALSAYGQTSLTLILSGASVGSPVQISVVSACLTAGKATLSPSTFSATSPTVTLQYKDNQCGALGPSDELQATIIGTANSRSLSLPIEAPSVSSLGFVFAVPDVIYLKGSGLAEASVITFEVRDAAGNPLPNQSVVARLLTQVGGVMMEGGTADVVRTSDAQGRVNVRVNSGTLPTPVRVSATLQGTSISTVSSQLSVAIGLPSQINFSLSQGTKNIEGYDIDGTPNTYQIIAADRSGNPVPIGTAINFVAEGGQIEAIKRTELINGIARATANFVSSEPRPVDGRVTMTTYALGEESFIDLNGNNAYEGPGSPNPEPFQDLGDVFKDRNFDGTFNPAVDEYVPLAINNSSACAAIGNPLLNLDPSIPSVPGTCSGNWSGAGQVYVRRATETVLATSGARPLWANTSGLTASCLKITLQTGSTSAQTADFTLVAGDTWYGGRSGTLSFIVADANPGKASIGQLPRLNPMAAQTTISATSPTKGLAVVMGGGTPVASTSEATLASISYDFTDPAVTTGVILITYRSPSGTGTTVSVPVEVGARPTACP